MTPKWFLILGGVVLIAVGVLGFIGIIGPTAEDSIFGEQWWFDNAENWAHAVLGSGALVLGLVLPSGAARGVTLLLGLFSVGVGIYNLFETELLGANLESPADLLLHLVIGAWALLAAFGSGGRRSIYAGSTN